MKRELAPIRHKDSYSAAIERQINGYFAEVIYGPLLAILEASGVRPDRADQGGQGNLNAKVSAVAKGLDEGRIWYADGTFTGNFTAAISRELRQIGAKWAPVQRAFILAQDKIPSDLMFAVTSSVSRSTSLHQEIERTLDQMLTNVGQAALGLQLQTQIDRILVDLTKQFLVTTAHVDKDSIAIPAEVSPAMAKEINQAFTQNLDKYIKDFTVKQIPELRKKVAANAYAGGRADRLARIIEVDYGVAKRKAAFLAEQETSLLVSKYRETRYKEIGAESYRWSTSHDEKVRRDHRALDKQVFTWASPPVTNRATGATNHPGEDFRCRCVAIPILDI